MKINNKFTKIFFIFLFFIFIFLFNTDCSAISMDFLNGEYNQSDLDNGFCSWETTLYFLYQKGYISDNELSYPYMIYNSIGNGNYGIALSENPAFYSSKFKCLVFEGNIRIIQLTCRNGNFNVNESLCYRGVAPTPPYGSTFKGILFQTIAHIYNGVNAGVSRFCVNYDIYYDSGDILFNKDNSYYPPPELSSPVPPTPTQNYTLYLKDYNLMKQFKFEFKVPLIKEDTKVFCFLEDYTRNSYDSVTGTFKFYTVSTPEDYDYTDYKNYMYYDSEDKKLYLPAGCIIERYSCTATNGDLFDLTLEASYTSMRDKNYLFHNVKNENSLNTIIHDSITIDNPWSYGEFNEDTLFPTSLTLIDLDCSEFLSAFGKAVCNVPVIR